MNRHRIGADKVVIEDDQRVIQYDEAEKGLPDDIESDRRRVRYDYSQKQTIIYVPVEPQPKVIKDGYFHYGNIVCSLAALESEYSPFNPDDTLILQKWPCPSCGYTLEDEQIHFDHHLCKEHDTGQQYNVVKVLGAENRLPKKWSTGFMTIEKHKEWHWKLLMIKR